MRDGKGMGVPPLHAFLLPPQGCWVVDMRWASACIAAAAATEEEAYQVRVLAWACGPEGVGMFCALTQRRTCALLTRRCGPAMCMRERRYECMILEGAESHLPPRSRGCSVSPALRTCPQVAGDHAGGVGGPQAGRSRAGMPRLLTGWLLTLAGERC